MILMYINLWLLKGHLSTPPLDRCSRNFYTKNPIGQCDTPIANNFSMLHNHVKATANVIPHSDALSGLSGRSHRQPWLQQWPLLQETAMQGAVHNKPLSVVSSVFSNTLRFGLMIIVL
ncbi:unnamed protein product [Dibothriocephalus latus]|uniref:Uncharacterized protein n=1 Tax=Dibothriocephalus latus TaxID=60516 RepID=A0A3P6T6S8_DIBLA|nr:unnamed protein product [Dibothriocephalus latus]